MLTNSTIDLLMNRKSIRKYTHEQPSDEVVQTVVRAGQQAPIAYQFGSLLLSRNARKNPFHAPLYFTVCVDSHRFEQIMAQRDWQLVQNDLFLMVLGMQDAALMAENMVIAAESLGMGSWFLSLGLGLRLCSLECRGDHQGISSPSARVPAGRFNHGLPGGKSTHPAALPAGILPVRKPIS